ncbi:TetR/AcrR family transcriptional regulator [Allorhizobium taibaishanense]|uniref:AcrR family transcriptional regulator n=2 Tax=Allorhizobium taibaishanense TaxID=887144 RepID=A0A7W6HKW5_9HYPH|nr:TetR/AcrR family transcriptional regulator [Allorhizobium taibaishanense]MBB4006853.1 AcrR family transcriptional regulator [Allorhizobium taibaishanense]
MSTRMAKSKPTMRKQPVQARSKVTVDAIVEAAARILSREGWTGFTTNKVAEAAGVSVGSYYQYFPDKHSLVSAIRERHLDDCRAVLKRAAESDGPLSRLIGELVDDIIAIHSIHSGLHRVLLDEIPNVEAFRDPESDFEKEYLGYFTALVGKHRKGDEHVSSRTIGVIMSDAVDGVVHNAARRGNLQSAAIRHELVRMMLLYLSSSDA